MPDLLLVATTGCDLDCDHCFGPKSSQVMTLETLERAAQAHAALAARRCAESVFVYWQGGDVLTLGREWLGCAAAVVREAYSRAGVRTRHHLQTSLLSYDDRWAPVLRDIFGTSVSTSFDFPNLGRRQRGRVPEELEPLWRARYEELRGAGFHGSVIALVNEGSIERGPAALLAYFFEEVGVVDLQVNLPMPSSQRGHSFEGVKALLESGELSRFMAGLYQRWAAHYRGRGPMLSPFVAFEGHLASGGARKLPCVWSRDCGEIVVAVGPGGVVGPCDVWVLAYPERCYGRLDDADLEELLAGPRRRALAGRASELGDGPCSACDCRQSCFGGCSARALAWTGDEAAEDPMCATYRAMLAAVRAARPRFH